MDEGQKLGYVYCDKHDLLYGRIFCELGFPVCNPLTCPYNAEALRTETSMMKPDLKPPVDLVTRNRRIAKIRKRVDWSKTKPEPIEMHYNMKDCPHETHEIYRDLISDKNTATGDIFKVELFYCAKCKRYFTFRSTYEAHKSDFDNSNIEIWK